MSSNFITRIEHEKDEPYTVIFTTDDAYKFKHIEGECRKVIGHGKPTDVVPVVRCKDCKWFKEFTDNGNPTGRGSCENDKLDMFHSPRDDWFCADGKRKEQDDE